VTGEFTELFSSPGLDSLDDSAARFSGPSRRTRLILGEKDGTRFNNVSGANPDEGWFLESREGGGRDQVILIHDPDFEFRLAILVKGSTEHAHPRTQRLEATANINDKIAADAKSSKPKH
jgi:hypothetical protein